MWIAVGGTPQSVVRAGVLGLPLTIAIIGGQPDALRAAGRALPARRAPRRGHDPETLPLGINTHAFVGDAAGADARSRTSPR